MPEPEEGGAGVDVPSSAVVLSTVAVSPRLSRYPNFRCVVVVGAKVVVFKVEILADDDDVDGGVSAVVVLMVDVDVRHSPNKTTAAMFNRILFLCFVYSFEPFNLAVPFLPTTSKSEGLCCILYPYLYPAETEDNRTRQESCRNETEEKGCG